jgi:hypothetical protein
MTCAAMNSEALDGLGQSLFALTPNREELPNSLAMFDCAILNFKDSRFEVCSSHV